MFNFDQLRARFADQLHSPESVAMREICVVLWMWLSIIRSLRRVSIIALAVGLFIRSHNISSARGDWIENIQKTSGRSCWLNRTRENGNATRFEPHATPMRNGCELCTYQINPFSMQILRIFRWLGVIVNFYRWKSRNDAIKCLNLSTFPLQK